MSIANLKVHDLMSRQVVTIDAKATLRAAAQLMHARRIHCLLVPAESPEGPVGVVTTKDIVQVLCDADASVLDRLRVEDAATTPAMSVQHKLTVVDCIRLMRMTGVRSAPVLDGLSLVGLISFSDVLRAVAEGPKPGTPVAQIEH
ncbi:MAG TPA: CBS domain-containing protein [Polyangiaceae bacterium]|jgi:CBS domain-containing protein|nr:CBS domain-containing protein [Polyangiaceae bacterium]